MSRLCAYTIGSSLVLSNIVGASSVSTAYDSHVDLSTEKWPGDGESSGVVPVLTTGEQGSDPQRNIPLAVVVLLLILLTCKLTAFVLET